ncbi:MAG: SDR family oxidoreductase [Patescibacteria group bacterium]|nr:SDR family oxidoreductase [Patescibacteria group bacterium]MDE1944331.1 SDR family oxidoreductase [Patescibacteria group bacterium]MDE1944675.1 SDR family oxidoreductase [Patescibacteria group bacterium]MDE2057361.1 SDR family oxidoreductase [Patescibacteria group bacterium]
MFRRSTKPAIAPQNRVVLIAGGSGELGQLLSATKPDGVTLVNISRQRDLEGEGVINYHFDLTRAPEKSFAQISSIVPRVDVFVYAAYSRAFSTFERLERGAFLKEYELDVFAAAAWTRACADRFWLRTGSRDNSAHARKAIWISSVAAFAKTARPELASYSAAKAALNALGPYAHDYLFETSGIPLAILAPGSLSDPHIRTQTAARFWELVNEPLDRFVLERLS